MNTLVAGLKTLQVINHIPLFKVQVPAIAAIFFSELLTFANYDPFPTTDFVIDLFGLNGDSVPIHRLV